MSAAAKLGAFAVLLAVAFGAAAVAGGAVDPDRSTTEEEHSTMTNAAREQDPIRGLAVAESGLRVAVDDVELRRGRTEQVRFRVVDARGATVRDFDVEHEKRMHLIIVRRDLTGFQHLHPTQGADGAWTAPVRLEDAGSYRLFADFARGGTSHTLASDLRVDGPADLRALPSPAPVAAVDGYEVRLDPGELRFTITRDGRPVEVERYLGAGGHLVALREGDLAFLHVHPTDNGGADGTIGFEAEFPTEGRYRLFLQFQHEGKVHTVAFTREVAR